MTPEQLIKDLESRGYKPTRQRNKTNADNTTLLEYIELPFNSGGCIDIYPILPDGSGGEVIIIYTENYRDIKNRVDNVFELSLNDSDPNFNLVNWIVELFDKGLENLPKYEKPS